MRPSQTPQFPWQKVSIDFVGPLPVTKRGFNSFMSVICNLTCMCHLVPCKTTDTASDVARRFLRDVVRLNGLPETLVSDRDVRFTSKFWKSLCERLRTRLLMTSAFNPKANGKVVRLHHALGDILRAVVNVRQDDWDEALDVAELAINDTPTRSTGVTPFESNYGRHPRTPLAAAVGAAEARVPAA